MAHIDHEKLNRLKLPRQNPMELPPFIKRSKWLPIGFGLHYGKTMPSILFDDPQYLGSIVEGNFVNSSSSYGIELNRQARVVAIRAERILARDRFGLEMQFVIVADCNDVFERFVLCPKGVRPQLQLAEGSRIVKRCTKLGVPIVCNYANEDLGFKRMGRCLRKTFTYKSKVLSAEQQYELFVGTDSNFSVSSRMQDAFL